MIARFAFFLMLEDKMGSHVVMHVEVVITSIAMELLLSITLRYTFVTVVFSWKKMIGSMMNFS